MKRKLYFTATAIILAAGLGARAEVEVLMDHNQNDEATPEYKFKTVPPPAANDAATTAAFTMVTGPADPNGGGLDQLHDGRLPDDADQPEKNFFFRAGTDGGRLQVDLGRIINVKQVNTYSWHPGDRGPQRYKLYASDGVEDAFNAAPKSEIAPDQCGWKLLAAVNTRPKSEPAGGQYGVSISEPNGSLGQFRYLLFDIAATERDDAFGNTFYSEMDVVEANVPAVAIKVSTGDFSIKTTDGTSTISINTDQSPGLKDWAEQKLAPVLAEWYPKIEALLPSEGYTAPKKFTITIKPMNGVAYTAGKNVVASSAWLEKEIGNEAVGSIVHELVHVVQQFGGHGGRNPGWLVEGSADYIRWFKYEPQSHGADLVWLRKHHRAPLCYNESYRGSANFLNWVTEKYDANIVGQMSAAMREGKYADSLWLQYTGKPVAELGAEWEKEMTAQLASPDAPKKAD